jgi:hypothetical protein
MSIFDNKSIWLSDIRRSNDSLELRWIMGQCQYYMINAWTDYVREVQENRGMDIVSHEHFKEFEELYLLAKDYDAEDDTKNWVFCLSEKADDLGQWRGYANDGQGISIGFNSAFLKKINFIGDAIRTTSVNFCFDKVHYSRRDVKMFFNETVGLAKIDLNMEPDEVIQYMKRALALSYIFSPLYKSDKFKDEKEWRVFYSMYLDDIEKGERPGISDDKNILSDIIRLEKYKFERKGETMVSHLELELPQFKRAINNIIIGPKAKVTPMDMRLYLMSIGLLKDANDESIKIHRSMISYR